jgi:hypothetical protein
VTHQPLANFSTVCTSRKKMQVKKEKKIENMLLPTEPANFVS